MFAFPSEGELLRFSYLRHHAHAPGEELALAALVRQAVNEARDSGDHFLLFTCADGDPVAGCLRRIPRTTYHYQLTVGCNAPDQERELSRYFESTPFDDAALA